MQLALDRLQQWCSDWQLQINTSKCHVLHLGKNNNNYYSYYLNGFKVGVADAVTDLGVNIDRTLKYDKHINNIVGRAYSRVGILFKGFASRSVQVLRQAYITYVRPVLEYASSVWSPHLIKHINAIERLQKKFTKRIPSISHLSYPERLAAINLEPLELRRLKADLTLYYKCFHNLVALPAEIYFNESTTASQTRTGGNRLTMPRCSTNMYQNDFFNRCISCWNALPLTVINASSVSCFKRLISCSDMSNFMHCSYF